MIYSAIVLAITFYTYAPAKLLVPLFLAGFLVINFRKIVKFKKTMVISLLISFAILAPLLISTISGNGQNRFNILSIYTTTSLEKTKTCILNDQYPAPSFCKNFVEYKMFLVSYTFIRNYLLHMSPDFLFRKGDSNIRHNIGKIGQLYRFECILVIIGIIFMIVRRRKEDKIILWWLLIFPAAASLTYHSIPHAIRSLFGLPSFQIIASIGIVSTYNYIWQINTAKVRLKKYLNPFAIFISIVFIIFAISNIKYYFKRYYMVYPKESYLAWSYNVKELVSAMEDMDKVDNFSFIMKHNPYIYILFYTKYDPVKWQNSRTFEKYKFKSFSKMDSKNQVLVVNPGEYSQLKTIKTIVAPNGTVYYEIKELNRIDTYSPDKYDVTKVTFGGLNASYFNGTEFNNFELSKIDSFIDFDWDRKTPAPGVNEDNFSIRWDGFINIEEGDKYKFYTISDDGVRLFIDGSLIIENWRKHHATENNAEIFLEKGVHKILLEYNEASFKAMIRLLWSSSSIGKSVIPSQSFGFDKDKASNVVRSKNNLNDEIELQPVRQNLDYDMELISAAETGDIETVKTLVSNGADINVQDKSGFTLLHLAAGYESLDFIDYLLENGANTNVKDNSDITPLHIAAWYGNGEFVKKLLSNNADINAKNRKGRLALHLAAENGHIEVVRILINNRTDIETKDADNLTPLNLSQQNGHTEISEMILKHIIGE